jgi:hypothetical protein
MTQPKSSKRGRPRGAALLAIGILGLCLTGCTGRSHTGALFPDATLVRVYVVQDPMHVPFVDRHGHVAEDMPADKNADVTPQPGLGGEARLRTAVHYGPEPEMEAACCIPRTAFTFFDAKGKFLGYLKLCFLCGCAIMSPDDAPDNKRTHLYWDRAIVRPIIENHHLKPPRG